MQRTTNKEIETIIHGSANTNENQVVAGKPESLPIVFSHVTFNVTVAMLF